MQLRRYKQLADVLFADALNSVTDLAARGFVKAGTPTVVDSQFGKAISFASGERFSTSTGTPFSVKTVLIRAKKSGANAGYWSDEAGTNGLVSTGDNLVLFDASFNEPVTYIDGIAFATTGLSDGQWHSIGLTSTAAFSIDNMMFGDWAVSGGVAMRDMIAFDRVLTAAEILSIHNGSAMTWMQTIFTDYDDVTPGVTYWPLSDTAKADITNNLTAAGAALGLTALQLAAWNAEKGRL